MPALLPNGQQQFLDNNGLPLSGGQVFFYIPNTTTLKATYQDSGQTVLNSNPVILDSAGRAVIYGTGAYSQVLRDSLGNLIWSANTTDPSSTANGFTWGGTTTGVPNAQVFGTSTFSASAGQAVAFIAGLTNTGAMTLQNPGGIAISVVRDTDTGPVALGGGEVVAGNMYFAGYDPVANTLHLVATPQTASSLATMESANITDLGTANSRNVQITGTATIQSFGASASPSQPLYFLTFTGTLVIQDGAALACPYGRSITTSAGDSLFALYLGFGNWQIVYPPANMQREVSGPEVFTEYAIPSASPIAWDMSLSTDYVYTFPAANRTLSAPVNQSIGQRGKLRIIQDAIGGRKLTWNAVYSFAGGMTDGPDKAANAQTIYDYWVRNTNDIVLTRHDQSQYSNEVMFIRATDNSITSNTALTNDDTLQFTAAAASRYIISVFVPVTSGAGGVKIGLAGTTTVSLLHAKEFWINQGSSTGNAFSTASGLVDSISSMTSAIITMDIRLETGVTGGTFTIQFAQNSSSASATVIKSGAYLKVRQF